eukprot:761291-Hanusia_phi.AAC.3
MAKLGLLDHLVDGILNFQISGNLQVRFDWHLAFITMMQTNFDLLGELVKYNPEVFLMFSQTVDDAKYKVFMQVVVSNLVDSNVFIRAVVLSLEFFSFRSRELAALGSRYDMESCKLHKFLKHNTVRLLKDLMTVISVEDINQENICCLNTGISFAPTPTLDWPAASLVSLHIRPTPWPLERLRVSDPQLGGHQQQGWVDNLASPRVVDSSPSSFLPPLLPCLLQIGFVTNNFSALLKFWLEYYLYRSVPSPS